MAKEYHQLPLSSGRIYRVGLTERHGMVKEYSQFPPSGVEYSFLTPIKASNFFLKSQIKGYFSKYESAQHDLIEAILSPIFTKNDWIYYLEDFHVAMAFNLFGIPLPRTVRAVFIKKLMMTTNFKKLIFWSDAGRETLSSYGGSFNSIQKKATVVYPAIRTVPDKFISFNKKEIKLLFSGDFFRKGGVNVLDAFERIQKIYTNVRLRLCCDEKIDFYTKNEALKKEVLTKIKSNPFILFGRTSREDLLNNILPKTDIYLLPTYAEAFGFAVIEAMAFGIPVISTNHFAIPEMIEHEKSGFLIDISQFNCEKYFKGYLVNEIPENFRKYVTDKLFDYLCQLIESAELREKYGLEGLKIARTKFSFNVRHQKILRIYQEVQ